MSPGAPGSGADVETGLAWKPTIGLIVAWVMTLACIIAGPKSVGMVVKVTMPLPMLILVILFFRCIFLDGADGGIRYYLTGDPDGPDGPKEIADIWNIDAWTAAASQIFFSLSLAMGIMPAYASYNHGKKQDVIKDALVISIVNCCISFFAGFVVFSILGHMAHDDIAGPLTNSTMTDFPDTTAEAMEAMVTSATANLDVSAVEASGPGLAFVVFPKGLAKLPGANFWGVLFFTCLWTLGLDSAFSLVEALQIIIVDNYPAISRPVASTLICLVGCPVGLLFTSKAGL